MPLVDALMHWRRGLSESFGSRSDILLDDVIDSLFLARQLFLVMDLNQKLFIPRDDIYGYDNDTITVMGIKVSTHKLRTANAAGLSDEITQIHDKVRRYILPSQKCAGQTCAVQIHEDWWEPITCQWLPDYFSHITLTERSWYKVFEHKFAGKPDSAVANVWPNMEVDVSTTIAKKVYVSSRKIIRSIDA